MVIHGCARCSDVRIPLIVVFQAFIQPVLDQLSCLTSPKSPKPTEAEGEAAPDDLNEDLAALAVRASCDAALHAVKAAFAAAAERETSIGDGVEIVVITWGTHGSFHRHHLRLPLH